MNRFQMNHLFFKLLLMSGIPFGFLMGIMSFHMGDNAGAIRNGILSGLIFGTLVSYILISLHKSLSRKVVSDASMPDFNNHQVRRIVMAIPFEQAFSRCIESLKTVNRCRIILQDPDNGEIRARAGLNWKTWGDDINFKLTQETDSTVVELSSRSSARSTLVDFGKNLDNVERIRRFLHDH